MALFQSQDRARGLVSAAVAVVFAVVSVEFLSSFCRVSVVLYDKMYDKMYENVCVGVPL